MTNKQAYAGLLERLRLHRVKYHSADGMETLHPINPDGPEAAEAISSLLKAGQRASAFIRDLATCDTMIMAPTLIAEADALDAALNSDAPLSIGRGCGG